MTHRIVTSLYQSADTRLRAFMRSKEGEIDALVRRSEKNAERLTRCDDSYNLGGTRGATMLAIPIITTIPASDWTATGLGPSAQDINRQVKALTLKPDGYAVTGGQSHRVAELAQKIRQAGDVAMSAGGSAAKQKVARAQGNSLLRVADILESVLIQHGIPLAEPVVRAIPAVSHPEPAWTVTWEPKRQKTTTTVRIKTETGWRNEEVSQEELASPWKSGHLLETWPLTAVPRPEGSYGSDFGGRGNFSSYKIGGELPNGTIVGKRTVEGTTDVQYLLKPRGKRGQELYEAKIVELAALDVVARLKRDLRSASDGSAPDEYFHELHEKIRQAEKEVEAAEVTIARLAELTTIGSIVGLR